MAALVAVALIALETAARLQSQVRDTTEFGRTGTASIAGVVTSDDSSAAPIRRVILTIAGTAIANGRQAASDDQGRFAFTGLPAGRFTVTAEKPPFVKGFYGSKRAGRGPGTPIILADGQRVSIAMKLVRGGAISGIVSDERGNPIAGSQVMAWQPAFVDGERRLSGVSTPLQWAVTDDLGRYRLYGLTPGDYTISAAGGGQGQGSTTETTAAEVELALRELAGAPVSSTGPATASPPQVARTRGYFGGATEPSNAQIFTLNAGDERADVNVTIPLVRVARVEGISIGPTGQPMQNVWVSMVNPSTFSLWASPGFLRPGRDGRFTIPGLAPGQYRLIGRGEETGGSPNGPPVPMPLWAEADFSVDGAPLSGIVLQFAPGASVTGRAAFQGTQPPPDPTKVRLTATPVGTINGSAPTPPAFASPAPDGTFSLSGLAPGKYRLVATGVGTWLLRSAILNGRDTLDAPFEVIAGRDLSGLAVTFSDQASELSGTLFDQLGRPSPEYSVLVFSTDRSHWTTAPRRISGAIKLGSDGKYKVTGLPPGEYYIAALVDVEPSQLNDPSFLEMLIPASIKVSLGEGEKKTQDLRLGSIGH